MKIIKFRKLIMWLSGLALFIVIVGCAPGTLVATEEPGEPSVVTETPLEPEVTEAPVVTTASPTVILVSSVEADPAALLQTQAALETLTLEWDLTLVVQESLSAEMITPNVQIVVGVGPNLDLSGLAAGASDVFFVAVDHSNIPLANNLSVIGDAIVDPLRKAFMAGYLSALISTDYKVAALLPSDIENSDALVTAFVNGARFFCGICQPKYPPYNAFPQWETLATENASAGFQSVVDSLVAKGVEVLYVQDALASPEILTSLADLGVKVVGNTTPDMARSNWVGTIMTDPGPALVELWPDLLSGTGGMQIPTSITLADQEAGLVSDGRYRLFEEMVNDLEAGLISLGSTP